MIRFKHTVKLLLAGLTFIFLLTFSSVQGQRLGPSLNFGTTIETLGIGAQAEFQIAEQWVAAPSFIYFFPKNRSNYDYRWMELNANIQYMIDVESGSAMLYALGGLNFAFITKDYDNDVLFEDDSRSDVGLNLGFGSNFDIGKSFMPFLEIRFVVGSQNQAVFTGGIKFGLN